jgi:hypothetical protein
LHLEFAGIAVADDGEFGLFRSKFIEGNRFARSGEVDHSFGHAEFDGALRIFENELGFNGNCGGLKTVDQRFDAFKENLVAVLQIELGGRFDASEIDRLSVFVDQAIACDASAWIDAENNHKILL